MGKFRFQGAAGEDTRTSGSHWWYGVRSSLREYHLLQHAAVCGRCRHCQGAIRWSYDIAVLCDGRLRVGVFLLLQEYVAAYGVARRSCGLMRYGSFGVDWDDAGYARLSAITIQRWSRGVWFDGSVYRLVWCVYSEDSDWVDYRTGFGVWLCVCGGFLPFASR